MIAPFDIPTLTKNDMTRLYDRLDNGTLPQELTLQTGDGWAYGTPRNALEPLVHHWRNKFDWEPVRTELNQWHHYQWESNQGLKVHFIHEPSKHPNAIPLVLLHGWPSTFYEFHKVINPLRDDTSQPYHVIVPSLPGYGFSDPPTTPGFGINQMGDILNELILALGYSKYVAFGTDWGSIIVQYMGSQHHQHCSAILCTLFGTKPPLPTLSNLWHHPTKVARFLLAHKVLGFDQVYGKDTFKTMGGNFVDANTNADAGYRAIQATRPYSLAYGLADSPIGLLGWMLEKYHEWTDHGDDKNPSSGLPDTISPDEFLTQVTIYWLTNTMSSSIRLYYEFFHRLQLPSTSINLRVPFGISLFKYELARVPKEWIEMVGDLAYFANHPVGGHFAALETPDLLVSDLQSFGKKIRYTLE
ncbi:Alpha/Beta hydrolase protein [Chlamydoabsidia padenii]|nr:Alpha/Beta hydrolase protein [Chlamydoabsidia padenii]